MKNFEIKASSQELLKRLYIFGTYGIEMISLLNIGSKYCNKQIYLDFVSIHCSIPWYYIYWKH